LKKLDVDQGDLLHKRMLKHILGGYGTGSKTICCRYSDGTPGCHKEFTSDTCYGHGETCGGNYNCM